MSASPSIPARRYLTIALCVATVLMSSLSGIANAHPDHDDNAPRKNAPVPTTGGELQWEMLMAMERADMQAGLEPLAVTPCVAGMAGEYPCKGIDLVAFVPLPLLGGGEGNDIWGWTDPVTERDFVIMGRTTGVTFVEITNPLQPEVVGTLATHSVSSIWRDLKVYDSHAFIVSEAHNSGLQVFDLRRLVTQKQRPFAFTETAWLGTFSRAHNIAINEASGYAYAVGTETCNGGLHMIDIRNPVAPKSAGCFSADGYTHDVQCVDYHGPDATFAGREVCFASNEDTLTIVDVTDKANPTQISRTGYTGAGYAHQGWLTYDHAAFIADDELDELTSGGNTRTYVWDLSSLTRPLLDFVGTGTTTAIDHNQYIKDGRSYQADYKAGLRVISMDNIAFDSLKEVAFFDTHPASDNAQFDGAWSVYPYYRSNIVAISTIDRGLFIVGYAGEHGSLSVADIDNRAAPRNEKAWRAIAKVQVEDEQGEPVVGATVTVRWANGRIKSCITGAKGRCRTSVIRSNAKRRIAFRVIDLTAAEASYASWRNHDIDGDSNGLNDMVPRPA